MPNRVHAEPAKSQQRSAAAKSVAPSPGTFRNEKRTQLCMLRMMEVVGSGTFGVVFLASLPDKPSTIFAVKKILQSRSFKNRELEILKEMAVHQHPSIVKMHGYFYELPDGASGRVAAEKNIVHLNIVMEYMEYDLFRLISELRDQAKSLPLVDIRLYAWQIARGLVFMHALNIVHRDLKPHNILVNPRTKEVRICDMGSAKNLALGKSGPNIAYITSRCYRAPELLFDSIEYGVEVDIWSLGCILGEMFISRPLFRANDTASVIKEIFSYIGTPEPADMRSINPSHAAVAFEPTEGRFFKALGGKIAEQPLDLCFELLRLSPEQRISAAEVLAHSFFSPLCSKSYTQPNGGAVQLHNFLPAEMHDNRVLLEGLIPN